MNCRVDVLVKAFLFLSGYHCRLNNVRLITQELLLLDFMSHQINSLLLSWLVRELLFLHLWALDMNDSGDSARIKTQDSASSLPLHIFTHIVRRGLITHDVPPFQREMKERSL